MLDAAAVRFVFASADRFAPAKPFADRMGLATGWNTSVSLRRAKRHSVQPARRINLDPAAWREAPLALYDQASGALRLQADIIALSATLEQVAATLPPVETDTGTNESLAGTEAPAGAAVVLGGEFPVGVREFTSAAVSSGEQTSWVTGAGASAVASPGAGENVSLEGSWGALHGSGGASHASAGASHGNRSLDDTALEIPHVAALLVGRASSGASDAAPPPVELAPQTATPSDTTGSRSRSRSREGTSGPEHGAHAASPSNLAEVEPSLDRMHGSGIQSAA